MSTAQLTVRRQDVAGCTIVDLAGRLDTCTYGHLRDSLIKLAIDQPDALVARVDRLEVTSAPALTVFSAVWMRISEWPSVPLLLVAGDEQQRHLIDSTAVPRFVPTFATLDDALGTVRDPPQRRRATAEFPPLSSSSHAARLFVQEICREWSVGYRREDALGVATELVENAISHGGTPLELRLELRPGFLTVAVRDANPQPAVLRQRPGGRLEGYGLQVIAALSQAWGCSPYPGGGKVVWAVLNLAPRKLSPFTV
ncbi:ATP-binding protein [Amycolatopsis thermophila]|uniref:Anti-sigma regulatory factor (Ser/Thr protein kinase) n=1 Tax=Amycolatopsis thermophila TaxID=206084 RepID=A0ABU0ENI9_9PSEU|nr:ATP-binding protein [Amycolatopsis thermophila]MDQ0376860.1 anti-sigma regulatory factor (Ser/Thr protein kinase) [Amycolatopsis thermophila]